jgi:hypothetical protein
MVTGVLAGEGRVEWQAYYLPGRELGPRQRAVPGGECGLDVVGRVVDADADSVVS